MVEGATVVAWEEVTAGVGEEAKEAAMVAARGEEREVEATVEEMVAETNRTRRQHQPRRPSARTARFVHSGRCSGRTREVG